MALRILSKRSILGTKHIANRNFVVHHRRTLFDGMSGGGGRFTQFFFAIGAATFGAAYLYKTVYGSYKEQKIAETKDELKEAGSKAIEYYKSGQAQEKYANWKQDRNTNKMEKKQRKRDERKEKMDRIKENIDSGVQMYKDAKAKLQSDD